jgi:hypothetical protein
MKIGSTYTGTNNSDVKEAFTFSVPSMSYSGKYKAAVITAARKPIELWERAAVITAALYLPE